jgi:cation-transporting ATPase I
MRLPNPFELAAKVTAPITGTLGSLAGLTFSRRAWSDRGHTHLEVRGMHHPGTENAARDLRRRLGELPGVQAVAVNAVLGRVVVQHDTEQVGRAELAAAVTEVERTWVLSGRGVAPGSAAHPANGGPIARELIGAGLNLAGFGMSVLGNVLPAPLRSPAVLSLLSLADANPRMRAEVEARLGRPAADALFAASGALGHALGRRPLGALTDAGYRVCLHREGAARQRAWQEWTADAGRDPQTHHADPLEQPRRPVAVPNGPAERAADVLAFLGLTGYGAQLLAANPQRGLALLNAGVPRAAKLGREAFCAQLSTSLSGAGTLVLNPGALRRLDRVDNVVLDASTLLTGQHVVDHVALAGDEADPAEVVEAARDLIDPAEPQTRHRRGDWSVAPITELAGTLPGPVERCAREQAGLDVTVVVVLRGDRPVGVAGVVPEIDPLAEALVEAAGCAGTVVLGGTDPALAERLGLTSAVPGGGKLGDSVRELQADGHVVAVVSAADRAALAAADVGIGLLRSAGPPWGADLLCHGMAPACLLLGATPLARQTSKHSAQLTVAGSTLGLVLGGLGPPLGAPSRAAFPVHFAGLLALLLGTWQGMAPGRRAEPIPVERTPWHAMSPDAVLRKLGSSPRGIDGAESQRRRGTGGQDVGELGLARASAEELTGPLTPALAGGAGVSASLGSLVDAVMIIGVLGLNALIGGAQRVGADRELNQLQHVSDAKVRVRRGEVERTETATELAAGDVVELHAGDTVPADCRVLEASGVEVDESGLTGESQLVRKLVGATVAPVIADRSSMLYQGSVIAAGHVVGVVVAVGEQTEVGRSSHIDESDVPTTGVAGRMRALTRATLPVTFGAGVLLMIVDLLRGRGVNQAMGRSVSLSVASVPEGLPFVATVAELASARRLAHRGVLAKSPSTIEALGRVDVLCFDKTGTLTEGRVALRLLSDGHEEHAVDDLPPGQRETLAAALRASPWQQGDRPLAHPTDRAVFESATGCGVTADHGVGELRWLADLPFEPSRGYHAVLAEAPHGALLSVKGAPETVLARCRGRYSGGSDMPVDAGSEIGRTIDRLARGGYRVLAVAERSMPEHAAATAELDDSAVTDLEFRGLLALADPVRPTAAAAVAEMARAGVDILMITGDHPSTAEAIAAELGVLDGRGVLTGAQIDELDDNELDARLPDVSVYARVSPVQKARIVRRLREAGRVVAMTGDGANDVPAIRLAHVGIAVGALATPATREAADLVVTDDAIETITDAIVEGRAMWSSVRDALAILLGGNLGEIAFTVGAGVLSAGEALNARQLLLVNLLTDVLPSMAVAVRPPPHRTPEQLLAEGPEASLGGSLNREITVRAITTAASAMGGWLLARPVSTPAQASTTALVALVGGQMGQTLAVRGATPVVIAASVGSMGALAVIVQVPGVSHLFGCRPLLPHQWAIALGASTAATAGEALYRRTLAQRLPAP